MFLSRMVNHAIEIIAPHIKSKDEELQEEWKSIKKYYDSISTTKSKEQSKLIDLNLTKIPVQRKCIEFIFENYVLRDLVKYAKDDVPKGMIIQVLNFFTHFILNVPPKLLNTSEISSYIQRLILISYESDIEEDNFLKQGLVKLIHMICRQMIIQPVLIGIYFERSKGPDFPIFSMLLDYMNVLGQTGMVSREALYLIINMLKDDKDFSNYLIKDSQFFETLEKRLKVAFATLPNNNTLMVNISSGNRNNCRTPSEILQYINTSKPEIAVEEFFEFWQFINKIAGVDNQILISKLSDSLVNEFIKSSVIPALLSPLDEQATAATTYMIELIKHIKDHQILDSLFSTLLGHSLEPERIPQEELLGGKITQITSIREILINRCSNAEDRLSLSTLRLFDSILETYNQFALYNLVFRNLSSFSNDNVATTNNAMIWNKKSPRILLRKLLSLMPLDDNKAGSDMSVIVESVDKANDSGFGYEDYFLDAQRQVQLVALSCNNWIIPYPSSPVDDDTTYYEGTFIHIIFKQLENFLQVPLERNLVLTSIISKLACMLDEKIDWLLYGDFDNSYSSSESGQKSLINILEKITIEAKVGASNVPNFQTRLKLVKCRGMKNTRRLSYGNTSSSRSSSDLGSPISPVTDSLASPIYKDIHINPFAKITNFVNAFIILQEFCKELAAIIFVKYMDLDQGVMIIEEEDLNNSQGENNNNDDHVSNTTTCAEIITEKEIILMRNREKFARLVALAERQQEINCSNDGNSKDWYRGRRRSNTIGHIYKNIGDETKGGTEDDNNSIITRQWSLRERKEKRMTHDIITISPLTLTNNNVSHGSPLHVGVVRKGSLSRMKGLTKKGSLNKSKGESQSALTKGN
ncbi:1354_t:CDS:2 [Funneliformis geosporum]|uniref:8858_t:CDS:1 n=1 Tax=Funneliformis geosporum TaxID=1117311 RepID=A0A9W4WQ14_9GLOM|nr:1354_t:CDS:2 [Funneliformis geosporum]CAI2178462.1 8858_t:CDS:2 [Funneliformis geosporum]